MIQHINESEHNMRRYSKCENNEKSRNNNKNVNMPMITLVRHENTTAGMLYLIE